MTAKKQKGGGASSKLYNSVGIHFHDPKNKNIIVIHKRGTWSMETGSLTMAIRWQLGDSFQ